jgi:hypothetical protein
VSPEGQRAANTLSVAGRGHALCERAKDHPLDERGGDDRAVLAADPRPEFGGSLAHRQAPRGCAQRVGQPLGG